MMVSSRARNVLDFVKRNTEDRVESLANARVLLRHLGNLSDREKLFLECALRDKVSLRRFHRAFRS
jgi:hypothetical protein